MKKIRRVAIALAGVVGLGVFGAAHGADAVRGKALFSNTNGAPLSCGASACHAGFPTAKLEGNREGLESHDDTERHREQQRGHGIPVRVCQQRRRRRHRGLHRQSRCRHRISGNSAVRNDAHLRSADAGDNQRGADGDDQQYRNRRSFAHRAHARRYARVPSSRAAGRARPGRTLRSAATVRCR